MSKIYTKTGDDGSTGLLTGERVKKSDERLEAYGQVDHLNSMVGLLVKKVELEDEKKFLLEIQNKLFDLGSLLACPSSEWEKYKLNTIDPKYVTNIEEEIDRHDKDLPKLKNFILPGGTESAALAHLCRTQCRNVERRIISIELPENALNYINRLSDYFFSLARFLNHSNGIQDILWNA